MNFPFSKKIKLTECFKRYFSKLLADDLLSPNTIEKYKEIAKRLTDILGDISIKNINDKTVQWLKIYMNKLELSPSRKNHFLIVIRNLLQFLSEAEKLKVYDYRLITKYKVPQKEVVYLEKDKLIKISNAPSENTITGLRMRAAIKTFISTGCRVSELLALNKDQINFETGIVSIRTKGNKPHQIIFNQASLEAIKKYLEMRGDDDCEALFATVNTNSRKRLQCNDLQRSLRNLGRKLGFKINVTPHLIARRSTATLMFKEGVPLGVIQRFLNHSSSQVTTKFYIGNLDFEEVKKHHKEIMNFDIDLKSSKGGEKK